jgi:flagellar basal body-associated protein FliL
MVGGRVVEFARPVGATVRVGAATLSRVTTNPSISDTSTAPPRPKHRLRNVLLIVVAFLVVLGVAAGGTFVVLYDKATEIDRSTPQVATSQFLDALLLVKDPARVALFVCNEWSAPEAIATAAAPTDPAIAISWGDFVTTLADATADVVVRVAYRAEVSGRIVQQIEVWQIHLKREDGWRVCGVAKTSESLNP